MGQDRRLGVNRRVQGDRRIRADQRGYYGPEKRSAGDRRNYIERRREAFRFPKTNLF